MKQDATIFERLYMEYRYLCLLSQDDIYDRIRMAELVGKAAFAAEHKMITVDEWEMLFGKIYKTVYGG